MNPSAALGVVTTATTPAYAAQPDTGGGRLRVDTIIRLIGEIDCASGPAVEADLMRVLSERGDTVVADLAGVSFLDCAGLGSLVAVRRWAAERGLRFRVMRPTPAVWRLLSEIDQGVLDLLPSPAPYDPGSVPQAHDLGRVPQAHAHDPGMVPQAHDPGMVPQAHDPGMVPEAHDPGAVPNADDPGIDRRPTNPVAPPPADRGRSRPGSSVPGGNGSTLGDVDDR